MNERFTRGDIPRPRQVGEGARVPGVKPRLSLDPDAAKKDAAAPKPTPAAQPSNTFSHRQQPAAPGPDQPPKPQPAPAQMRPEPDPAQARPAAQPPRPAQQPVTPAETPRRPTPPAPALSEEASPRVPRRAKEASTPRPAPRAFVTEAPQALKAKTAQPAPNYEREDSRDAARARGPKWIHSLSFRIGIINLIGLLIFMFGVLLSNQYRQTNVDERIAALQDSSGFFAGALKESALLELTDRRTGEPFVGLDRTAVINLMRSLILPTNLRAEVYDITGKEIYDSGRLDETNLVSTRPLVDTDKPGFFSKILDDLLMSLVAPKLTPDAKPGEPIPEVMAALSGEADKTTLQAVRLDNDGNIILSVAAPIPQVKGFVGAVRISTRKDEFRKVLRDERSAIFQIFGLALLANLALVFLYSRSVVGPIKRLAEAADKVRLARQKPGKDSRAEIPGFHRRKDEIGDLAVSLNDMTRALNARLDAIETFAADVSHEIKTPLTSMRSAIETMDIAKTPESKARLMEVIKHDVDRLDRLITDISNASRLDAELSREDAEAVNIPALLQEIVAIYQDSGSLKRVDLELDIRTGSRDAKALTVLGIESRLGQVIQNVIENALSFSPDKGTVWIRANLERPGIMPFVSIRVEDEGPGIPEESLEKIFQRFYTQRPSEEDFGKNSGLGLSISKQIIEAHNGQIWAENIYDDAGEIKGARFSIRVPAQER